MRPWRRSASREIFPGVRLLTSLRDPAERCFSHYLYIVRSGRAKLGFEDTISIGRFSCNGSRRSFGESSRTAVLETTVGQESAGRGRCR